MQRQDKWFLPWWSMDGEPVPGCESQTLPLEVFHLEPINIFSVPQFPFLLRSEKVYHVEFLGRKAVSYIKVKSKEEGERM